MEFSPARVLRAFCQGHAGVTEPQLEAAFLGAAHAAAGDGHDVSVEAIKEGERVTKLIVTCRCGDRIEILCAYGPNQH